ncbi:MAG TPA: hypothetical protein PKD95_03640 [Candidatus Paceibacterota bacterium]|nr:hypothetical protein [Candidatus Paceibacterota bacterium]
MYLFATDTGVGNESMVPLPQAPMQTDLDPNPITATSTNNSTTTATQNYSGFDLTSEQKEALVALGVDSESVPASVTAEQERCLVAELGENRVVEIKDGAVPTNLEFMRIESCI